MAAEAATFVASDGELAGQLSVVDSSVELGAADLRPQDLVRSSSSGGGSGGNSASSDAEPVRSAEEASSRGQLERPIMAGVERPAGGVDPRVPVFPPAGRRVFVAVRVDFHVRRGAMRLAAFLVMFVAAMSLTGDPDAPRPNQFRALMVWLGGCILLFLLRH